LQLRFSWSAGRGRANDLLDLQSCLDSLPSTELVAMASGPLALPKTCRNDISLTDPFSGEPYTFRMLDQGRFAVCGTFETPAPNPMNYQPQDFNLDTGCLTFSPTTP
jgi:hypothetical protein